MIPGVEGHAMVVLFKNKLPFLFKLLFFHNQNRNSSPVEEERESVLPTVKKVSSWKARVS